MRALSALLLLAGLLIAQSANSFKISPANMVHQKITWQGLASLFDVGAGSGAQFSPFVIAVIVGHNIATDASQEAPKHFDSDQFISASMRIMQLQQDAIDILTDEAFLSTSLLARVERSFRVNSARALIGGALHTIQDFYSHSNWVERSAEAHSVLLSKWGNHHIIGGSSGSVCTEASPATSALSTGHFNLEFGFGDWCNDAPANKCNHGDDMCGIHKDGPSRPQHGAAVTFATEATTYFVQETINKVLRNAPALSSLDSVQANQAVLSAVCQFMGATDTIETCTFPIEDCVDCPIMVNIPGGTFQMGDISGVGDSLEQPVHSVTVPSFAMGVYEVSWDEWEYCVAEGGCDGSGPDSAGGDGGYGKGSRPVINVSWDDAKDYVAWLSQHTGKSYRLPSESEWEYATRAGTETQYWFGAGIGFNQANCDSGCDDSFTYTSPVGSFASNAFGLYDVHGNVVEWVEDCWNPNYTGAPTNGTAWLTGGCSLRVLRGGSWNTDPSYLRSADRIGFFTSFRNFGLGFRVAQDQN